MLGVAISTVDGKFRMTFSLGAGAHTSITAAQMSTAKSISVAVKLSGEYSKTTSVPDATRSRVLAFTMSVASVASLMISS